MEKYHKQDVAPIEKENERDENYKSDNPQIDSERTRNNYRFTPYFGKTYTEFINGRIKELGLSPRKDAVVMNSFVLGSDKTFFDGLAKVEQYNFFSDCYKFFVLTAESGCILTVVTCIGVTRKTSLCAPLTEKEWQGAEAVRRTR